MAELKEKYQCPCGSLVLKNNAKQHNSTKKHLAFTGGIKPANTLHQKKAVKQREPSEEDEYDEEEEEDQEDDEGAWEDDVTDLLTSLNTKLDNLNVMMVDLKGSNEQTMTTVLNTVLKNIEAFKQEYLSALKATPKENVGAQYINEKCH